MNAALLATCAAVALALLLAEPRRAVGRAVGLRARLPSRPIPVPVRRAAELEWLEAVAAELRAGRDPASALRAASGPGQGSDAAAAAVAGGDVADTLRKGGSDVMRAAAACWDVADGSGAGLAAALTALADAARDDERVRRELRTGLAEPRATAFVLAALPIIGLGLGAALGADPVAWLLGTAPGRLVAAVGVVLEVLGALWALRIVRSLEAGL